MTLGKTALIIFKLQVSTKLSTSTNVKEATATSTQPTTLRVR